MRNPQVVARQTADAGGRRVDIIKAPQTLSAYPFQPSPGVSLDDVRTLLVGAMRELVDRPSKRRNDRNYIVWLSEFTNTYGTFMCVCLPDPFDYDLHKHYQAALSAVAPRFIDAGRQLVRDVEALPALRWEASKIIVYVDGFSEPSTLNGPGVEERSYQLVETTTSARQLRASVSDFGFDFDEAHDLAGWSARSKKLQAVVGALKGPFTYRSLVRLAGSVGIRVVEEGRESFGLHGLIQLGWLDDRDQCGVTIRIKKSLPVEQKYFSLAHELGHYVLHFPLLYVSRQADQVSAVVPFFDDVFSALLGSFYRRVGGPAVLEIAANALGSYFLVPAWADTPQVFSSIDIAGETATRERMVWNFLQPLFPDTAPATYSWINEADASARARRDAARMASINSTDASSMSEVALAASLRRNEELNIPSEDGIAKHFVELMESFGIATDALAAADDAISQGKPPEPYIAVIRGLMVDPPAVAVVELGGLVSEIPPLRGGVPLSIIPLFEADSFAATGRWRDVVTGQEAVLDTWRSIRPDSSLRIHNFSGGLIRA